ncbi:hypothetical protein FRACYDRAFT_246238 [Fragilariopsis cylindrus CCMP1102]|uniref:Uncharacterized protein n=1 Tax=Fragilariopsis cylindrus CCMP1102 TaxID=635003 RepID=A0A1E7EZ70_9STRA|nr:hypothetical protein FRACYDRAFT_246238 [Fragilariopsis cylindrus CCMP1102]|eukprot:OEU11126.1 hypothetical protein FRACYDRAFT_246238 [Fragilariopsis cylindrus CCMP1102]
MAKNINNSNMQQADGTNTYPTSPHIAITSNFVDDILLMLLVLLSSSKSKSKSSSSSSSSSKRSNSNSINPNTNEIASVASGNSHDGSIKSGNTSGNETDADDRIITSMPYHLSSSPSVLCNYNNNFINNEDIRRNRILPTNDEGNQADIEDNNNSNIDSINAPRQLLF